MALLFPTTSLLTDKIIGAAIRVHRTLGPGLLESAYQACLARELVLGGHSVALEVEVPVVYKGIEVKSGFRADMIIDDLVLIEVKAVARIIPIHEAQVLTYLKLTGLRTGLLLNFNVPVLKDGLRRFIL